jgi:hypothetical protein
MAFYTTTDSVNAVVADIGSYATKIGFAGEDYPRSYFRSVSGIWWIGESFFLFYFLLGISFGRQSISRTSQYNNIILTISLSYASPVHPLFFHPSRTSLCYEDPHRRKQTTAVHNHKDNNTTTTTIPVPNVTTTIDDSLSKKSTMIRCIDR